MKVVETQSDGILQSKDQAYLGRAYNFVEVIKLRGIGSPKFLYDTGIAEFDKMKEDGVSADYVSIELFTEGLVIRFKGVGKR